MLIATPCCGFGGDPRGEPTPKWWPRMRRMINRHRYPHPDNWFAGLPNPFLGAWIEKESDGKVHSKPTSLCEMGLFQISPVEMARMIGSPNRKLYKENGPCDGDDAHPPVPADVLRKLRASRTNMVASLAWGSRYLKMYVRDLKKAGAKPGNETFLGLMKYLHSGSAALNWTKHVAATFGGLPSAWAEFKAAVHAIFTGQIETAAPDVKIPKETPDSAKKQSANIVLERMQCFPDDDDGEPSDVVSSLTPYPLRGIAGLAIPDLPTSIGSAMLGLPVNPQGFSPQLMLGAGGHTPSWFKWAAGALLVGGVGTVVYLAKKGHRR